MLIGKVKIGAEARKKLIEGINILSDAVSTTLGPAGRNAIITEYHGDTYSTKDGVTVAKQIRLGDPLEDTGAQLIKQAAIKTGQNVGDGTTTSTVLARELVEKATPYVNNGENAVLIKRQIDDAVKEVVKALREDLSEEISTEEQIEQIATISSNNDKDTGKLISTGLNKVGSDGIVHIQESRTGETYLETVEGLQWRKGFESPYFVTDNSNMTATLNNPYILIIDGVVTQLKDLLPILEEVSQKGNSLLVVSDATKGEALAGLIVNKMRGTLNVCSVSAPEIALRRKNFLEDLATLTGGQVFSKEKGMRMDKFSFDWLGSARAVTVTKGITTIVDGKGDTDKIKERIVDLQSQIESAESEYIKEKVQERLARMVGGVAVLHVGGYTDQEIREKKDRVEDALYATKAAIEQGIVPGGGKALLEARKKISTDTIGGKIVYEACSKPFTQILNNAGHEVAQAQILANDVCNSEFWESYDIFTDKISNFKDLGIVDPTKVTVHAIQNAGSIAGTILLTETVVYKHDTKQNDDGEGTISEF
jgi:chaperonin GroEL